MIGGVLVTGGSGFLGCAVLQALHLRGVHPLTASVRSTDVNLLPELHLKQVAGLGPDTDWKACVQGVNTVIHCAARAHVIKDKTVDPLAEYRMINVAGTLALARQAAEAGVRRFVFISSIKVNGELTLSGRRFLPDDTPAPEDAYAISKLEAERGLMAISRDTGMEIVIIRPPLVYGPGVKGNFAAMIRWISGGMPLPLGAVHNRRSLVALDNLVDLIVLCADRERSPRAANEVFLIADGEDVSTTELLRKVARAYGVKPRLLPVPAPWMRFAAGLLGKGAVADRLLGSLVVDSLKARDLLGWRPVVSMDEQLQKMARHDALV